MPISKRHIIASAATVVFALTLMAPAYAEPPLNSTVEAATGKTASSDPKPVPETGTSGTIPSNINGPSLIIPIPDVKLSNIKVQEGGSVRYIDVPWIAEYVSGTYKYAIGFATLLATVMFMIGGFQYLTSGGDKSRVDSGKKHISDAVIGMLLVLGCYTLLKVVNPDTLTFSALRVPIVKKNAFKTMSGVLEVMGSTADDKAYANIPRTDIAGMSADAPAPADVGGGAGAGGGGGNTPPPPDVNPAQPGAYRKTMLAACGNADGLSLGSTQEKLDRLRTIVATWKVIGADQGGAVYIRGGSINCGYSGPQPDFVLASMVTLTKNGVPPSLSGACQDAVTSTAADPNKAWDLAKSNPQCAQPWTAEYNRLIMDPPRKAGMACGDCVSFMLSLYGCFDKSFLDWKEISKYRTGAACPSKNNPKYVFVLGPDTADFKDDNINAAIEKLQFGDMISWQKYGGPNGNPGHNFLYTGKAGLNFEMMEMGGGGKGDVSSQGGAKASKNAGYKWTSAGVQAWGSAFTYLKNAKNYVMPNGAQKGCIYAYRLIK